MQNLLLEVNVRGFLIMKKSKNIYISICCLIMGWIAVSYFDVLFNNLTTQNYFSWNFFTVLLNTVK